MSVCFVEKDGDVIIATTDPYSGKATTPRERSR
jgi:hypothetical protein